MARPINPQVDTLGRSQRWRMRLSEAIDQFVAQVPRTRATATGYKSDLRLFLAWLNARIGASADSVLKFTEAHVAAYLGELKDHRREATQHRKLATFRKFGKWGARQKLWSTDPMAGLESIPKAKRLPRPFTDAERDARFALPLDATQNALRAVLFFSGLRATAASRLRVQDVSVSPPRIAYVAKGGKDRVVPMHPVLKDILWDFIASHTDLQGPSFIFRNRLGLPFRRATLAKITAKWGKAAGVPQCTPHRFRHTFGTELLRKTKNLRLVQEAMGHADIQSTLVYTQVAASELEAGVARLYGGDNNPSSGEK